MTADPTMSDTLSMDTSSSAELAQTEAKDTLTKPGKRRSTQLNDTPAVNKRLKLLDMVFYDGNRHPAAVLHELHPEISSDKYLFTTEDGPAKQTRFRCSVTIDEKVPEPVHSTGVGRSKQLAKNMAAQVGQHHLVPLYSSVSL